MINHSELMYYVTKEEYIDILSSNILIFNNEMDNLRLEYDEKQTFYDQNHQDMKDCDISCSFGIRNRINTEIYRIRDIVIKLDEKVNILKRSKIDNINFVYESEEMKNIRKFFKNNPESEIILKVAEE